jgi:hypothetical protein
LIATRLSQQTAGERKSWKDGCDGQRMGVPEARPGATGRGDLLEEFKLSGPAVGASLRF